MSEINEVIIKSVTAMRVVSSMTIPKSEMEYVIDVNEPAYTITVFIKGLKNPDAQEKLSFTCRTIINDLDRAMLIANPIWNAVQRIKVQQEE